jgi:hypothetical protein
VIIFLSPVSSSLSNDKHRSALEVYTTVDLSLLYYAFQAKKLVSHSKMMSVRNSEGCLRTSSYDFLLVLIEEAESSHSAFELTLEKRTTLRRESEMVNTQP